MDASAIIALAVGLPTLVAAAGTLYLQWKAKQEGPNRTARAVLAEKLTAGQHLLAEVLEGAADRDFGAEEAKIVTWRDETVGLLQKFAPDQIAFFESSAGMTSYGSRKERDRIANYVRGRCARLGEILGRI